MNKFDEFQEMLIYLTETFEFTVKKEHKYLAALFMAGDVEIAQLMYHVDSEKIIIIFHHGIASSECIPMFIQMREDFKSLCLGEQYYRAQDNNVYFGAEAETLAFLDLERAILEDNKVKKDNVKESRLPTEAPPVFTSTEDALKYFNKIKYNKGSQEH